MLHFATIVLSAFMAVGMGTMPACLRNTEQDEPVYYQETNGFYGDSSSSAYNVVVEIPYTSKTLTATHSLALRFPTFNYAPVAGCCGAIAGANAIAFYDRYDENLIPNHVSGQMVLNAFAYNIGDQYTNALITQLYEYMAGDGVGMTEKQFKDGFTKYCKEKGKSVSFTSCMSSGAFSYSKLQTNMKANQPILLFLSTYNVMTMYLGSDCDEYTYRVSTTPHIMVGYGYKSYTYVTSEGTKHYDLVSVSSGLFESGDLDFFDIKYQTKIDDALAVNIY